MCGERMRVGGGWGRGGGGQGGRGVCRIPSVTYGMRMCAFVCVNLCLCLYAFVCVYLCLRVRTCGCVLVCQGMVWVWAFQSACPCAFRPSLPPSPCPPLSSDVFFGYTHTGVDETGIIGQLRRAGRPLPSNACGALVHLAGVFAESKEVGEVDPLDHELYELRRKLIAKVMGHCILCSTQSLYVARTLFLIPILAREAQDELKGRLVAKVMRYCMQCHAF